MKVRKNAFYISIRLSLKIVTIYTTEGWNTPKYSTVNIIVHHWATIVKIPASYLICTVTTYSTDTAVKTCSLLIWIQMRLDVSKTDDGGEPQCWIVSPSCGQRGSSGLAAGTHRGYHGHKKTTTIIHHCYHVDIPSQLHHTVTVLIGKLAQLGCVSPIQIYFKISSYR